jgi:hypothetical protein
MMKYLCLVVILTTCLARGGELSIRQESNTYLTLDIPSEWKLEVVAGKEGEMQMSLRGAANGTNIYVPLFAYWGGLDPRQWVGTNVVTKYKTGSCNWLVRKADGRKELWMIAQGKTYIIDAVTPLDCDGETLALLLNCLNTIKPK